MRIIIEEYQYPADIVEKVLDGISTLRDINGNVSVSFVGYYYNPTLQDTVFILPKVLLGHRVDDEGNEIAGNNEELVFGKYQPKDIIDIEKQNLLEKEEYDFIYELSVWIYRAIVTFRDSNANTSIVLQQNVQQMAKGRLQKCNTFLDILLALQKFNRDNQDFFFFILRNIHSGYNKINWTRTIAHSTAYMQSFRVSDGSMSQEVPLYLNPVNKKRQINFDEELLIIFFSILRFINRKYGFPVKINVNFPLITDKQFDAYCHGMGKARLLQIKYKYFSDKALYLWELCYAFFDQSKKINVETDNKEYLLVKDFNIVFETIIDELVGDPIPDDSSRLAKLKHYPDGKQIDHIYQWQNLTNNDEKERKVYYIGDSKYYKRNTSLDEYSVTKQFTYARNVIQWNLDLFNDGTDKEKEGHIRLRDDVTEGYNVIPNFFISAQQNTLRREDDIQLTQKSNKYFFSRQFENRLFDRDTFLIAHYDVNFLFVIAMYGKNNSNEKAAWKIKVRNMFREQIQAMLKERFLFYALTPHEDVNADKYIRENFQLLLGKVFKPFEDKGTQQFFSLALRNPQIVDNAKLRAKLETENEGIRQVIDQYFYRADCELGTDPSTLLPEVEQKVVEFVPKEFRTRYFFEAYMESNFLIGCYKNREHLDWIFGRTGKRDNMYNIRIDKDREGSITKSKAKKAPSFLFLYNVENPTTEGLMMFKIHNAADTPYEFMKKTGYPGLKEGRNYISYVLETDPITFGEIDIVRLLEDYHKKGYKIGEPFNIFGKDLIHYRKPNVQPVSDTY